MLKSNAADMGVLDIAFLSYRKLRKIDLAVLLYSGAEKLHKGEHMDAATRRFFKL